MPDSALPLRRRDDPALVVAQREVRALRRFLVDHDMAAAMRAFEAKRPALAMAQLALAIAAIGASVLVVEHWLLAPLVLMIVGSSQRSIGNLLHDASHGNIFGRRGAAILGNALLAPVMFESFASYRRTHLTHHAYLGDSERDPDFIALPRKRSVGTPAEARREFRYNYLVSLTSWRMFRTSLIGDLGKLGMRPRLYILAWWAALTAGVGLAFGWTTAWLFLAVWIAARATTYHVIKVFTEYSDHIGLEPGSIVGYTRNSPRNALSVFIHPFNDNYHLLHHLAPRVPMANMHRAHVHLLRYPPYRHAHQCDGYLAGDYPVVVSCVSPRIDVAAGAE